jgi:hypothetical protein
MTGYLQRLAASVRPQTARIRPAVTPLYARGAARDVAEEPGLEEENLVVAARREAPTPRETDVQAAEYLPPTPARATQDFEAAAPVERLFTRESRTAPEPRRARASQESTPEVFEASRPDAPARKTVVSERIEVPPAPALLVESRAPRREDVVSRAEPARRRESEGRTSSRPDEIHINIGRVEVISAPPPAPRVAAPASKAVSLEDYLRGVSARQR